MARSRPLFYLIALLLPLLLLGAVEGLLRLAGIGERQQLFVAAAIEGYRQPNERVVERFFANPAAAPRVSIDTTFFTDEKAVNSIRVVIQGGSSAAGFPYGKWASPAGMLQQRLERAFPGRQVEVISTAMSAVNSYALLDFADEIIEIDPDVVVIYAGHNEFLGVLGAGSAYASSLSPELTRATLSLRRSHLVEAGFRLYGALSPAPAQRTGTLMARVAKERRIPADGALFRTTEVQFEGNIQRLLKRYREHGIPVLIGTLAANEKDQSPFLPAPPPPEVIAEWNAVKEQTLVMLADDTDQALTLSERLVELAPDSAESWFLRGRARLMAGDNETARVDFLRAKDLDQLRFRAPELFNQIIRETARTEDALVVEVQTAMAARSPGGSIGHELMVEHLHPNVDGYFIMADTMYQSLIAADILGPPGHPVGEDLARTEMPVTAVDRLAGDYRVGRLKLDWPFRPVKEPFQLPPPADEIEQIAQAWFSGRLTWNEAMNQALDSYQRDGNLDESVRVAWNLAAAFPFQPDQAYLAGTLMLRAGDPQRALGLLYRAVRLQPRNTRFMMSLAQAFYQSGRTAESIQVLERVLALEPAHPRAPVFLERLQQESSPGN
ncbi:MAG: tetratricopeptide repeat protein [Gammaproteobacteria bacterium]